MSMIIATEEENKMNKSTGYRIAQLSVLADESIKSEDKLFILSLLMEEEGHAKWCEKQEAEEDAE